MRARVQPPQHQDHVGGESGDSGMFGSAGVVEASHRCSAAAAARLAPHRVDASSPKNLRPHASRLLRTGECSGVERHRHLIAVIRKHRSTSIRWSDKRRCAHSRTVPDASPPRGLAGFVRGATVRVIKLQVVVSRIPEGGLQSARTFNRRSVDLSLDLLRGESSGGASWRISPTGDTTDRLSRCSRGIGMARSPSVGPQEVLGKSLDHHGNGLGARDALASYPPEEPRLAHPVARVRILPGRTVAS
jgi:hypothetical protein